MTLNGHISLTALLQHSILTARHDNGKNRIAATTEALQQTATQLLQLLNERAQLLSNSAQFDTALRDAAAIKALLPGSGLGYLCTGDVYCQQGRYAAAISIYDQGLAAVPKSDPYYQQLQQHRLAAISNNNKRVDFISRLPLDIVVTNILPRVDQLFPSDTFSEFLYISRSWQERIVKRPNGLRFNFDRVVKSFKNGHAQVIRFAPYVQSLQGSIANARLDDLFSRAHFSNLKKLNINCYPTTPRLPLIHGLQMIGDSLTYLNISNGPGLQLRDILETCPNLVFLKTRNVDAVLPISPSIRYPKLKQLALSHKQPERPLEHDDMIDLLKRFPSLRMLDMTPMPVSTALPLLHKHCPYLQEVSYEFISVDFGVPTANHHSNQKGIISAYLGGDQYYYQDTLIEFLYAHRNSLEVFDFCGTQEIDLPMWELSDHGRVLPQRSSGTSLQKNNDPSSPLTFTRLDNLRFLDVFPWKNVPMILWIVLNAPNLTSIHIYISHFTPDVARALIRMKHLRKIEFVHTDVYDPDDGTLIHDDYDGIYQFFEHHAAIGDRSTLEHVVVGIEIFNASVQTWLPLLSQLRCLKRLELRGEGAYGDCDITENCVAILNRIRRNCLALRTLTVNGEPWLH